MNNNELNNRVESLEERLMHQEAALDEMTSSLLRQDQQLRAQSETIRRLEARIENLADSGNANPRQEPPPPHY